VRRTAVYGGQNDMGKAEATVEERRLTEMRRSYVQNAARGRRPVETLYGERHCGR